MNVDFLSTPQSGALALFCIGIIYLYEAFIKVPKHIEQLRKNKELTADRLKKLEKYRDKCKRIYAPLYILLALAILAIEYSISIIRHS